MGPAREDLTPQSRTKLAVRIGILFALLFLGYHLYYYLFPSTEDQVKAVLKEAGEYLRKGEPTKALELVSEAYCDGRDLRKSELSQFAALAFSLYDEVRITFRTTEVTILDSEHAVVNTKFKIRCVPRNPQLYNGPVTGSNLLGTGKDMNDARIRLRREEGQWRIVSLWVEDYF